MRLIVLGTLAISIGSGCGESGPIPVETAPVTGSATYQGKPLENYRVFFYVSGDRAQEPATARIGADGLFSLSVREPDDGAVVGTNEIWFAYDPELPEEIPGMETGRAPPPPTVKLPEKYLDREKSGLTVDVPPDGLKDYKIELP